ATTAAPAPTTTTADAPDAPSVERAETVATGLDVPWSIAFLPDGDALVSERAGRIRRIAAGDRRVTTAATVPGVVQQGEGGLLGLAVSPTYAQDRWVYAYLTTARDNRIVRLRLGERRLHVVVKGLRKGVIHNGGRIAFGPDGKLYAGVGDTGDTALAQDRRTQNGKILRMNPDGSVPPGNPFRRSRVWSLGHRNVQGLAWDRAGRLWASEFGQDRRDEINLVRKGRNYGWPVVEGVGSTRGGRFTNPLVTWSTAEASPSGVAVANGRLYVAALRGERLWRIPLRGARTGTPKALLRGRLGRLRAVTTAPDGSVWASTSNRDGRGQIRDGDDRIVRFRP
ncbi:PQQ-dependent sugar dehydrogenase, partial [Patulibacter sp. S7RM1-6]